MFILSPIDLNTMAHRPCNSLFLAATLPSLLSLLVSGLSINPLIPREGAHVGLASSAELARRAPSSSKKVIVQMFEWNWDSIAQECTNFLGPQGYGYVQGNLSFSSLPVEGAVDNTFSLCLCSEPALGAHPGFAVVDFVPTCVIHSHLEARQSEPVPKVRLSPSLSLLSLPFTKNDP